MCPRLKEIIGIHDATLVSEEKISLSAILYRNSPPSNKNSVDAETYVLTAQCPNGGSLKWREGPYDCKGPLCPSLYPKEDAFYDITGNDLHTLWNTSGRVRKFGICRIKDENEWIIGTLIKYSELYSHKPYQCCPHGGDKTVAGCASSSYGPYGSYDHQPYQILYSGECYTDGMGHWAHWGEWGDCSKTCGSEKRNPGIRTRTRTCEGGNVGDLGCSDSTITTMTEPCRMAYSNDCNTNRCKLDMNFIDWYRFRLAHIDGVKNTEFWTSKGVYYNRKEDLHHAPRTWTGHFPEGSKVSGYRCVNPNTNQLYPDQHEATCVCSGSGCDWDREMPTCTDHGTDHPGYKWLMEESPADGSYCVSPIYGGVGYVDNGECVVTMAMEPNSYYSDTNQYSDRESRDMFADLYPPFNNYYQG